MRRLPDGKVVYDEDTPAEAAMMRWFENTVKVVAKVVGVLLLVWAIYSLGIKGGWRDVIQHFRDDPPQLRFFILMLIVVITDQLYKWWRRRD